MATAEQIRANRENARKSTGPKSGKDRTRFNGLKHGLRAEQVVIPGENPADFEAERSAWFEDWKPQSHTRAVLVERAAVAAWRLRRCVRAEAARLHGPGGDVADDFDMTARHLVGVALHMLPTDPGAAVARLRSAPAGLDCLIGLWEALAEAAEPGRWTSEAEHHDRLLNLLGHRAGAEAEGLEAARASRSLLRCEAADPAGASATLRAVCLERAEELRRERSGYWDPPVLRRRAIDAVCAPTSKESQLVHRYEMAHEQSLRSALRQLMALERSGADLPEEPEPVAEPEASAEAVADGPGEAEIPDATDSKEITCGKSASVGSAPPSGSRPGRSPVSPAGPRRPAGPDPKPKMAPIGS